ncbi:unnamed protein product [Musa hybrid cultivar]
MNSMRSIIIMAMRSRLFTFPSSFHSPPPHLLPLIQSSPLLRSRAQPPPLCLARSPFRSSSSCPAVAVLGAHDPLPMESRSPFGEIHVILGPMFAGKTTALLRRMQDEMDCGSRSVAMVKSDKDARYGLDSVVTHDGMKMPCFALSELSSFRDKLGTEAYDKLNVIGIDEAQFFEDLYDFCCNAADHDGKIVVVAGLDGDYLRKSFGSVLDIVPLADSVTKLTARCEICGKRAFFTLRKTNETQTELIGGADVYMPVCREHYVDGQVAIEATRTILAVRSSTLAQSEPIGPFRSFLCFLSLSALDSLLDPEMVGNPELSDGDLGGRGAAGGPPAPEMPFEGCGAGSGGWKGEEMSGREGRPDPGVSALAGANGARYKSMPPARLPITRAPCLTIPPGFSPSALLESPVLLTNMKAEPSPTTGTLNLSSVIDKTVCSYTLSSAKDASDVSAYDGGNSGDFEFKPHVPASYNLGLSSLRSLGSVGIIQAVQEPPVQNQSRSQDRNCITCNNELAPLASAPNSTTKVSNLRSSLPAEAASGDLQLTKCSEQSSQMSQSDPSEPTPSSLLEKSAEDGYNWRKYGQKHVKGSEYPRSYYKCTHPNCEMKKQIERSHDGQITGIIYIGKHDHPKPHPNRRLAAGAILSCQEEEKTDNFSSLMSAEDESTSAPGPTYHQADRNSTTELSPASISENDVKVGCGQSDNCDEVAGDADLESKRRKIEINNNDAASIGKLNHEPRVVVQTLSEVDILDDGYRWRKYGQKVVKGNPNPRSYYKCTSAGCPVRKHVERASHDPKAVITTYEGKHNHDVPAAKTANHEASASMVTDGDNSLSIHASAALNGMMRMRHFTHPFIQMESNAISLDLGVGISPVQSEITNEKQQCLENFQIQHHQPQCVDSGNLAIQTTPLSNFHGSSHTRIYPSGEDKGEGFTFKATPMSSDMYYSAAGNLVMGP